MVGFYSECDSPFALTNYTLDFIEREWAAEIDFVICEFVQSPHLFLLPLVCFGCDSCGMTIVIRPSTTLFLRPPKVTLSQWHG